MTQAPDAAQQPAPDEDAPEPDGRWTRWAAHPAGPALLFTFAVVEGCLLPAPTEALYAALALGRPRRAWALAGVAAAGSVVGGVVAWTWGAWFWDRMGARLLDSPDLARASRAVTEAYRRNAALALLTSGYTPVPYVVYGVVGGASGVPLGTFVLFSALGRGIKYALLALLARVAGPPLRRWMRRSVLAVVLAAAVIAALAAMAFGWM